jgi:hypothetical protein
VKIGVCRAHRASLRLLHHMVLVSDEITPATITYCLPSPRVARDPR